jgi:hypothetical protein
VVFGGQDWQLAWPTPRSPLVLQTDELPSDGSRQKHVPSASALHTVPAGPQAAQTPSVQRLLTQSPGFAQGCPWGELHSGTHTVGPVLDRHA